MLPNSIEAVQGIRDCQTAQYVLGDLFFTHNDDQYSVTIMTVAHQNFEPVETKT
jgi:hypothetical protein